MHPLSETVLRQDTRWFELPHWSPSTMNLMVNPAIAELLLLCFFSSKAYKQGVQATSASIRGNHLERLLKPEIIDFPDSTKKRQEVWSLKGRWGFPSLGFLNWRKILGYYRICRSRLHQQHCMWTSFLKHVIYSWVYFLNLKNKFLIFIIIDGSIRDQNHIQSSFVDWRNKY